MAKGLQTLEALCIDELRDLYHAESQLVEALPKMAEAASSRDLTWAFEKDLTRTKQHMHRLESIFARLRQGPSGQRCKGMEGLLQEGQDRMGGEAPPAVRDAGLVVTAQKAQHYEIAGYGSACTFAQILGWEADARVLHQTLEEEKEADEEFTRIARNAVNLTAAAY